MNDLRSEFEKWAREVGGYNLESRKGQYLWRDASQAFKGYSAAHASLMARLPVDAILASIELLKRDAEAFAILTETKEADEKHIAALTQLLEQKLCTSTTV